MLLIGRDHDGQLMFRERAKAPVLEHFRLPNWIKEQPLADYTKKANAFGNNAPSRDDVHRYTELTERYIAKLLPMVGWREDIDENEMWLTHKIRTFGIEGTKKVFGIQGTEIWSTICDWCFLWVTEVRGPSGDAISTPIRGTESNVEESILAPPAIWHTRKRIPTERKEIWKMLEAAIQHVPGDKIDDPTLLDPLKEFLRVAPINAVVPQFIDLYEKEYFRLRDEGRDPVYLAAWIHNVIAAILPKYASNGKVARCVANTNHLCPYFLTPFPTIGYTDSAYMEAVDKDMDEIFYGDYICENRIPEISCKHVEEYLWNRINMRPCWNCGKPNSTKICECKLIRYCSESCMKKNWPQHKNLCMNNWMSESNKIVDEPDLDLQVIPKLEPIEPVIENGDPVSEPPTEEAPKKPRRRRRRNRRRQKKKKNT